MNAITQVPGGTRAASRTVSGREHAGDGEFEIALGAAAASQSPPRPEAPERAHDRESASRHEMRSRDDVTEGHARDEASATDGPPAERRDATRATPDTSPGDAAVLTGYGAQNAPASPHPAVTGAVPAPAVPVTAGAVPELVPVVPAAGAEPVATATADAVTPPPGSFSPAQPMPGSAGLDVRVVSARPSGARPTPAKLADLAAKPQAPVSSDRMPTRAAVVALLGAPVATAVVAPKLPAVPAPAAPDVAPPPAPRLSAPAVPAPVARGAFTPPEANVPAPPPLPVSTTPPEPRAAGVVVAAAVAGSAARDGAVATQAGEPDTPSTTARPGAEAASASVRNAALAQRDSARTGQDEREPSAHDDRSTPQHGVTVSELPATSEPAPAPALSTMPLRTSVTTPDAPAPRADATAATMAADDARFEPMRRAADQVTLQFQGEGGLEGRLRISVRGDTVHASILSSHEGTLERLGGETGSLRRALGEQGFSQAKISVHDLRAGATNSSDPRQNAREGDDRRQGEPQRRSGQGRESRQGGDSAKDRRASRDERRSE